MTAEIYELGNDEFETGIEEIDVIEEVFAPSITIAMDPEATTHYSLGETVTGGTTGTTAEVSFWDRDNHELKLINRTGNFTPGETITGAESGTVQDSVTVDNLTLENTNPNSTQCRKTIYHIFMFISNTLLSVIIFFYSLL